jgi:O-antigen/teichoic acid export membrane protein
MRPDGSVRAAAVYGPSGATPGPTISVRALRAAAAAGWHRHHALLHNAGSLVATTGVTSAMGFVYWAFAARLLSQQAVGYGSAAVAAMTLLGTIGMFGLGTVLIGELPRRRHGAGLVSAALLAAGVGSLLLGLGFAVVAPLADPRFAGIVGTAEKAALFAAGVAVTGLSLVFDQATIGLMRGGLQLTRNIGFAVAKLLTLPAAALILHDGLGASVTLSWVAGMIISLIPVVIRLKQTGQPVLPKPDWAVLHGLRRTAMAHNWLNLAIAVPMSLIPVLVAVVVSPSANAAFYAAWMLASFLYIIPVHLSTVLFAVAAGDPKAIAGKLRFAVKLSLAIGLPGMAALGFGAHLALSLFGAGYARAATVPLWLLVIGYLPALPKVFYVAVCRATGRIWRAAFVLTAFAAAEIAMAAVGGVLGGLVGLSVALLAVSAVEGLVTTPAVVKICRPDASMRRAGRSRGCAVPERAASAGLGGEVCPPGKHGSTSVATPRRLALPGPDGFDQQLAVAGASAR